MNRKLICQILNHEMMLATGCTEPAAIALTAAIAREQLDGELEHIKVRASANIIKNAMSAGIPGTNYTGINYAAALGAVCGAVDRQLRVVDDARPEDIERAAHLVENGYVDVRRAFDPDKLYVEVELVTQFIEFQYRLDEELEKQYAEYLAELETQSKQFYALIDHAFDPDFRTAFLHSILLAEAAGVKESEILSSTEDIDSFFLD